MPTKSEVIYQRALYFRQLVSEILIKHYADDPKVYRSIVDAIFDDVFRDEVEEDTWNGEDNRRGDEDRRKEGE